MTVKEALQSTVAGYPLEDKSFDRILIKRGLTGSSDFDTNTANSKAFELSEADVLMLLLTAINRSEGDQTISLTEKSNFLKVATGIYQKWNEPVPGAEPAPTVEEICFW